MTKVRVVFARHAESVLNADGSTIGGRSNHVQLTAKGIEQAVRLGRYLDRIGLRPRVVYCSPAVRALQTCRLSLGEMRPLYSEFEPMIVDDIQEMDQGEWTGRRRAEIYVPAVVEVIRRRGKDSKAPGGESMNEVGRRKLAWMDRAFADEVVGGYAAEGATGSDEYVALVYGHGLAIKCVAATIQQWSHARTFRTDMPNTALAEFTRESGGPWRVEYVGRRTDG